MVRATSDITNGRETVGCLSVGSFIAQARRYCEKLGYERAKIIDNFFETLVSGLVISNRIKISSFGTFKVINTKERTGRNPKTKVEARIFRRKIVKFKPSTLIKKKINYND